ncbi:MAG: serine/threonine-protein kinase [Wenzhouxiangella sp.]|jgi:serine/threonine-protein kinase|nr:serine/threonine-protein kinase [Wenzhouxiangella sp.]
MDIEQWKRLAERLDGLLELGPDDQARELEVVRRQDPDLAELLKKALDADALGIPQIDEPLIVQLQQSGEAQHSASSVASGTRLGSWRLVRELGRGGMGQVWQAERDDGQYQHSVAVKIIEGLLDSPLSRQQLQTERQILADLDHPNIARLLDGGVREDGTPWYAMELIDGWPIDEYSAQAGLSLVERLKLLVIVARAVHYAHTRLVVHRDLKPGNILVDADGIPHLLDFGIAKMLRPDEDAPGAMTLLAASTPEYAAPEQLLGRPTTTATDVFALGVIAHELLTGQRPAARWDQTNTDNDAGPLPSASLSSRRDRALIRGDIDSIVAQALAPEPALRYASAEALADDIQRYLDGLPVQARRAGAAYRAQKFVRRHWLGVGMGSLAVASLCVALVWSNIQTQRAESALARANAVQAFLIEVFDAAKPAPGARGLVTQRDLAERAIERLDRVLLDQPEMAADTLVAVGRVFRRLGFPEQSLASLSRAETVLDGRRAAAVDPLRVDLRRLQGQVALQAGDAVGGVDFLEQALELAEQMEQPSWLKAEILKDLGLALSNLHELERAIDALSRAEALAVQTPPGALVLPRIQLLRALSLRRAGRLDEAIPVGLRAVASARREYGELDNRLASALSTVGGMHRRAGKLETAEEMLRQALEIEIVGSGQPGAATVNNLGNVLLRQGRLEEAREAYQRAIVLAANEFGADAPRALSYRRNLARFQLEVGEIEPALETLIAVEARYAQAYDPDSVTLMNMRNDLAWGLLEAGRLEEAERVLNEVTGRIAPDPENAGQIWRRAHLFSARRALDVADPVTAAKRLAIAQRDLGPYDMEFDDRIRLELLAGDIDLALGESDRARGRWVRAEAMADEHLGQGHPLNAQVQRRLQGRRSDLTISD